MPDEKDLTTVTFAEDVTGLLTTEACLLVLAFRPEYNYLEQTQIPDNS